MAKKKRGDAHGGGHGWFVTFADLMGLLMSFFVMLVAFSNQTTTPGTDARLGFDLNNQYRTDGCSYVLPQLCSAVQALWAVTGLTRNGVAAIEKRAMEKIRMALLRSGSLDRKVAS